jgi:hypothetical protein
MVPVSRCLHCVILVFLVSKWHKRRGDVLDQVIVVLCFNCFFVSCFVLIQLAKLSHPEHSETDLTQM